MSDEHPLDNSIPVANTHGREVGQEAALAHNFVAIKGAIEELRGKARWLEHAVIFLLLIDIVFLGVVIFGA